MPKIKTNSAADKRFRVTKNGKLIRRRQNARHLRAAKSKSQIRRMKEPVVQSHGFAKKIIKLLQS